MVFCAKVVLRLERTIIRNSIMGVCIGACARVDKNVAEINPSEKKQIESNLSPNQFDGEDCNLKTTENDAFTHKEQEPAEMAKEPSQPEIK